MSINRHDNIERTQQGWSWAFLADASYFYQKARQHDRGTLERNLYLGAARDMAMEAKHDARAAGDPLLAEWAEGCAGVCEGVDHVG